MHDDTVFILSHLSYLKIARMYFYIEEKSAASEKDKAKWSKVLIAGMMSSEESDSEDEDVIIIKPLQ